MNFSAFKKLSLHTCLRNAYNFGHSQALFAYELYASSMKGELDIEIWFSEPYTQENKLFRNWNYRIYHNCIGVRAMEQ